MLKRVFEGTIDYVQVMDENGDIDAQLFPQGMTDNDILEIYKAMCFARAVDAKVMSLQRQGRAVTYAPFFGEEGAQIGAAYAMAKNDFFVPTFRQHPVFFYRKFPLDKFFIGIRGFTDGQAISPSSGATPEAIPVGSQLPHAAGVAYAKKFNKENSVVLTFVGDGGTSEGDFYESINFAGVFKVPMVLLIENNQWAISVPRKKQTAAKTLAQKAFAAGIPGYQVDGNDPIAVYKVVKQAMEDARAGKGPSVVEALTYRMGIHTTADDPTKYRPEDDVNVWKPKDPILRVRKYLTTKNLWNDVKEKEMQDGFAKTIDEAVEKAEAFKADPKLMFETVYSFMPNTLQQEEDEAAASNFWQ